MRSRTVPVLLCLLDLLRTDSLGLQNGAILQAQHLFPAYSDQLSGPEMGRETGGGHAALRSVTSPATMTLFCAPC